MQSTQFLNWPSGNRAFSYLTLFSLLLCNAIVSSENPTTINDASLQGRRYDSQADSCEDQPSSLIWSNLLEDYILSSSSVRKSKDMVFMNDDDMAPINYHSSAYRRPEIFITKRIGEPAELQAHMRPPQTMHYHPQSQPMTNQMLKQQQQRQQPGFFQQLFGLGTTEPPHLPHVPPQQQQIQPIRPSSQFAGQTARPQNFRAVTENDLYLLGAIEKLVYRVDYLESRIRRAEQLIYYLMAGNNQKEVRDPCPANFTRISDNCYYINSEQQVNWKTANSACKALNSQLTEFEKVSENEEIMAYLLNQKQHRGRDYWLGGLNPGLLWIWSNSAKPVNPNMNLTSFVMQESTTTTTEMNLIDESAEENKTDTNTETSSIEIKGQGRCLRFSYNTSKHSYDYFGQECTSRHNYICEYHDKTLDNKIKKIARDLKLFL